jgi:hypothetical protein
MTVQYGGYIKGNIMEHHEITDLRCALPASHWSDADSNIFKPISQPSDAHWRVVEYKCDTHTGHMLWGNGSPDKILTIPLKQTGWQAIHILIAYADLDVRLSGEEEWQRIRAFPPKETVTGWREAGMWGRPLIWEPLRFADVTGKDLEIRIPPLSNEPVKHKTFAMAGIWGVRTTPMPQDHIDILQHTNDAKRSLYVNDGYGIYFHAENDVKGEEPESDNKRTVYISTGFSTFMKNNAKNSTIIEPALAPFQNKHWNTCCYGIGQRGYPNYPSKLVDYEKDRGWAFVREGDGRYKDNVKALIDSGVDTLQLATDSCHDVGQKLWMYLRPQLWTMALPFDHSFYSAFYAGHPHLRCCEANGQPISKMSIAYPEIREHFAAFIAEGLERGVDGICLALTRGYPMVRYEQPVLDRVRELYDLDATELPETDERLRSVWQEYMNEWLREIRQQLDTNSEENNTPRKELALFVHTPERNDLFGCDIQTWVDEKLVDVLITPGCDKETLSHFSAFTKGTDTQLIPDIIGGCDRTLHGLREAAAISYENGADGITAWDTQEYITDLELESPQQQKLWYDYYMTDRATILQSVGGEYLTPYNPALGG